MTTLRNGQLGKLSIGGESRPINVLARNWLISDNCGDYYATFKFSSIQGWDRMFKYTVEKVNTNFWKFINKSGFLKLTPNASWTSPKPFRSKNQQLPKNKQRQLRGRACARGQNSNGGARRVFARKSRQRKWAVVGYSLKVVSDHRVRPASYSANLLPSRDFRVFRFGSITHKKVNGSKKQLIIKRWVIGHSKFFKTSQRTNKKANLALPASFSDDLCLCWCP